MKIFKTGGKETMKKRRFAQLVLMITMLFCLTFGTVCAQAATTATTTTANQWKTVKGKRYYFGPKYSALTYHNKIGSRSYVFDTAGRLLNGKASRIVNVGKYSYYVNKYGNPSKGWLCLPDKNLYYADSCERFYKNRTLEGISFNGKGQAVKNDMRSLKLHCIGVVRNITRSGMSKSQKLEAAGVLELCDK